MESELTQAELDWLKAESKLIAIVVRNAMEDFHTKHLTDEQMQELNPIIRNAIFTALYAKETFRTSQRSEEFMRYHISMIPKYWEEPELLKGFKKY